MEIRALKPYLVVIGLMLLASLALALTVDVRVTDEAGIEVLLPDRVGEWSGAEVRYCLNADCQKEFLISDLGDMKACPVCGGELGSMSFGEKELLPGDTVILKKRYAHPDGRMAFVSIVLSGKERASIHRPQVCLVGQGNEIMHSEAIAVPIAGREPLGVMVLDLLRRGRAPDGRTYELPRYYAYWFVGKGRETPFHVQRMVWMAVDRIFHNVSHRWAYISVSGLREDGSDGYRAEIADLVSNLYPSMVREGV